MELKYELQPLPIEFWFWIVKMKQTLAEQ